MHVFEDVFHRFSAKIDLVDVTNSEVIKKSFYPIPCPERYATCCSVIQFSVLMACLCVMRPFVTWV
jgi:hypothetical protein